MNSSSWMLASGSESGDINFWNLSPSSAILLGTIDILYSHGSSVKKLAWTPSSIGKSFFISPSTCAINISSSFPSNSVPVVTSVTSSTIISESLKYNGSTINKSENIEDSPPVSIWRLASCGEDHTVRIFQISE